MNPPHRDDPGSDADEETTRHHRRRDGSGSYKLGEKSIISMKAGALIALFGFVIWCTWTASDERNAMRSRAHDCEIVNQQQDVHMQATDKEVEAIRDNGKRLEAKIDDLNAFLRQRSRP